MPTDGQQFRNPDVQFAAERRARSVVLDGRNFWNPAYVRDAGIEYHGVGRAHGRQRVDVLCSAEVNETDSGREESHGRRESAGNTGRVGLGSIGNRADMDTAVA